MILPLIFGGVIPFMVQGQLTFNCSACEERKCPPQPIGCQGHFAQDPCGCCTYCARSDWEPCGGENWEVGYCDQRLRCAAVNGTELVQIPDVGVCKRLPNYSYWVDDDENCPSVTGCFIRMGTCDCETRRTCLSQFSYNNMEECRKSLESSYYDQGIKVDKCWQRGCNIVEGVCVCETNQCDRTFTYWDQVRCNNALVKMKCVNITCPELPPPDCPSDSVLSKKYTPPGECCPVIPSFCTCNFDACTNNCPRGHWKVIILKGTGIPGNCCNQFECIPVENEKAARRTSMENEHGIFRIKLERQRRARKQKREMPVFYKKHYIYQTGNEN